MEKSASSSTLFPLSLKFVKFPALEGSSACLKDWIAWTLVPVCKEQASPLDVDFSWFTYSVEVFRSPQSFAIGHRCFILLCILPSLAVYHIPMLAVCRVACNCLHICSLACCSPSLIVCLHLWLSIWTHLRNGPFNVKVETALHCPRYDKSCEQDHGIVTGWVQKQWHGTILLLGRFRGGSTTGYHPIAVSWLFEQEGGIKLVLPRYSAITFDYLCLCIHLQLLMCSVS